MPKEALHRAKVSLGIIAVAAGNGSVRRLPETNSEHRAASAAAATPAAFE